MSDDRIEGAARKGLGHIQDAVGGLTGDARTQATGKLNEAAGSVQNAYGKVKDQADDVLDDARYQAEAVFGELRDYVREKPLLAVGLGVLTGVLLWHMLGANRKVIYIRK